MGGNLLGLLEDAGIEWYPMLRTNKVNPHPLQFGVYEDLVYHHGGGFRLTAGGRLWRASVEDRLNATLRGRLAARLPREGLAGRVRKRINPVRRYRQALGDELARVNEQVFELIQRDDDVLPPADRARARRGAGARSRRRSCSTTPTISRLRAERLGSHARRPRRPREAKIRSPSSEPVSGSTACSGCGISPITLPRSFTTPAMSRAEPFGFWPGA